MLFGRTAIPRLHFHAAALVGVAAVVSNRVLIFERDVLDGGGEELRGSEGLEVSLDAPASTRAVDDAPRFFVPSDLLKGKGARRRYWARC